jgi:hypothetical protein
MNASSVLVRTCEILDSIPDRELGRWKMEKKLETNACATHRGGAGWCEAKEYRHSINRGKVWIFFVGCGAMS